MDPEDDTPCTHVWQGDGSVAHCAHCEAVLFRPTGAPPEPCRWCGHTRPDHDETCPVRELAEGIARARETGEPFHQTVTIATDGDPAGKLAELWDAEDKALEAAGWEFAPIEDDPA